MKICFLDKTNFEYSYRDLYSSRLRGAETVLINISRSLHELGHKITVFNNCKEELNENNYQWTHIDKANKNFDFDVAISNNDVRFLDKISSRKKFVLSHSIYTIEKFIRKKQLISYLKNRPTFLLLGNYHKKQMSSLVLLFGSKIIDYGLDEIFLNTEINKNLDSRQSIFFSRQDRNLDMLVDVWKNKINPIVKDAKLLITPKNDQNLIKFNIFDRKLEDQRILIKDLISSKIAIIPGHKAELYCLAAEEAKELCLPIITLGIGSLSERVNHNYDGLIAKDKNELANLVIEMYQNNELWNELRSNLIISRGKKKWKNAAKRFLDIISNE